MTYWELFTNDPKTLGGRKTKLETETETAKMEMEMEDEDEIEEGKESNEDEDAPPPHPFIAVPVFQRMYCWSDEQVTGWWRDAVMGGGHAALRVKGGHATGKCLFRRVCVADELVHEDQQVLGSAPGREPGSEGLSTTTLLCLDGQQRSTTMQLALAAIRDAALRLVPVRIPGAGDDDDDDDHGDTETEVAAAAARRMENEAARIVKRINDALYRDSAGARRWIRRTAAAAAAAAKTGSVDETGGGDEEEQPSSSSSSFSSSSSSASSWSSKVYVEGARPPFATTLLPSFVDRAPFLECITAGPVAHALAGVAAAKAKAKERDAHTYAGPLAQSPALAGTPLGRAKRILDGAAVALLHPPAAAGARLAAAAAAALDTTRLVYIEVQGDDVDMAQAFQWLQEKTLFAAGAILWNPAPGIDFAACDLVRNALVSSFLRRSFAEQESAYKEVWLDPLQRRIKGGGGPVVFDGLLRAFLDGEDERRAAAAAEAAEAAGVKIKKNKGGANNLAAAVAGAAVVAAAAGAGAAAADGMPVGPRHVSATERDLTAMMESDQVPDKLKHQTGPGSPMWIYVRFRSYMEEVALAISGSGGGGGGREDGSSGAVGENGNKPPRSIPKFDFTSSAPPPPPKDDDDDDDDEDGSGDKNRATVASTHTPAPFFSQGNASAAVTTTTTTTREEERGGEEGSIHGASSSTGAPVPISEQACRVVVARLVDFAARTGCLVD